MCPRRESASMGQITSNSKKFVQSPKRSPALSGFFIFGDRNGDDRTRLNEPQREMFRRLLAGGSFPAGIQIGGRLRWNRTTVIEHINARAVTPTSQR